MLSGDNDFEDAIRIAMQERERDEGRESENEGKSEREIEIEGYSEYLDFWIRLLQITTRYETIVTLSRTCKFLQRQIFATVKRLEIVSPILKKGWKNSRHSFIDLEPDSLVKAPSNLSFFGNLKEVTFKNFDLGKKRLDLRHVKVKNMRFEKIIDIEHVLLPNIKKLHLKKTKILKGVDWITSTVTSLYIDTCFVDSLPPMVNPILQGLETLELQEECLDLGDFKFILSNLPKLKTVVRKGRTIRWTDELLQAASRRQIQINISELPIVVGAEEWRNWFSNQRMRAFSFRRQ